MLRVKTLDVSLPVPGGRAAILEGIDFTLEAGGSLGIVGESGSGKSMLALALMGLLPEGAQTKGQIFLDGENLLTLPESEMCRRRGKSLAMIFQEPMTSLNPTMSVGDQVAEAVRWHEASGYAAARARALDLLTRVGLPQPERRIDSYPHELSGGQRQRVGIAIALACRPKLLIADEPTTALDVTVQAQILRLLKQLAAEDGMALILISHDLGVVAQMAQRTMVLYAGATVEAGSTAALFKRPLHPYTRGLLGAMPRHLGLGGRLATIPGRVPSPNERPSGCRFRDRCELAEPECADAAPLIALEGRSTACRRWEALA
ncbi:ABC transporter ATP-binding protein [Lacibacterium aquatile]|uniref:ABC transporter ATP-binding protein n=1 Tax=Lacibacterium aquatile TaxID=1168082 RepID=A0ABW5DT39_9PROT